MGSRPSLRRSQTSKKQDWLSRSLSRAGAMTLREAELAIAQGRVTVSGRVVKQPFAPVHPDDEVKVGGRRVELKLETRVLMFHKPLGAVTSKEDLAGGQTVFSLLLPQLTAELSSFEWHAVGRLDRNTTGLLLFTNDERFVAHATSPQTHLAKRYWAQVQGQPREEQLQPLREGIVLDDGTARPAGVRLRGASEVEITLTEGRNHQVKRMLGAVGFPVRALHREAVGSLELNIPVGKYRLLTSEEVRSALQFP